MRKCIRCGSEMKEGFDIRVKGTDMRLNLTRPIPFLYGACGCVNAAVCTECGYVELYMVDTSKVEKAKL